MKVNYEYTFDDYKKYLYRSRLINNIVLFIIGVGIYLFLTFNKVSLMFLPLFIIGLIILILLLNLVYVHLSLKVNQMMNYNTYGKYILELTPNKFSVTLNRSKTDYKYNSISKIVVRDKYFKIKFKKSREYLTFEKRLFNEKEYNKVVEIFKSKSN